MFYTFSHGVEEERPLGVGKTPLSLQEITLSSQETLS